MVIYIPTECMKGATHMKLFTRNFTLLILGQASSLLGNGALRFAVSMYILDVTGSAGVYSLITALAMLPMIALSPLGGVLADRTDRRKIMVALDALSAALTAAGMFSFALGGGLWSVGALLIALGVLGAFESPTVQACVPQMLSCEAVLRGNALVSQVQAISSLVTPFLGAAAYAAFGLRAVMLAAASCFAVTALFECFIRLGHTPPADGRGALASARVDIAEAWRFMRTEQPGVLKLLLLAGVVSMFLAGVMVVGYPYLVRTTLGLSSGHYSIAESAAGVAAILGGAAVGAVAGRLKTSGMYLLIAASGAALIPAGAAFALPVGAIAAFVVLVVSFCLMQFVCSAFSICAVTEIQSRTPEQLTGKVMSFVYTLSLCAQPLGQVTYGALFDALAPAWVLLPSAAVVLAIAIASRGFFARMYLP